MKIPFTGYAHVSKEDAVWAIDEVCKKHGVKLSEEAEHASMYWGYEISFQCELDTETGSVEIIGCDGFLIDKSKKLELEK